MSTVRYFRWDDPGAPTLTGEVGSLTNLLRKCLVGTAGVAYGSKPAAGWSEAFAGTATNIAVFRNNSADGGSGCYVRVNDNASGAGGAREAQIAVYGSMTDINSGTMGTSALWFRKSGTADATARKWQVVADGRTAWLHSYEISAALSGNGFDTSLAGIGDYACVDAANAFRYFCMGRATVNSNFGGDIVALGGSSPSSNSAAFSVQSLDGISGLKQPSILRPMIIADGGVGGTEYPAPPHPITGDTYFLSHPPIRDGGMLLGRLRGIRLPYHNIMSTADGAEFSGYTGQRVAKTRITTNSNANHSVGILLDAVGPWP